MVGSAKGPLSEVSIIRIYGSLSKNGAILVRDGFLASAMSEVCFFHV